MRERRVVDLDVPSGLELATAILHDPAIRAEATVTLAAPKAGLRGAREAVGRLLLADIGIPRPLYAQAGIDPGGMGGAAAVVDVRPW